MTWFGKIDHLSPGCPHDRFSFFSFPIVLFSGCPSNTTRFAGVFDVMDSFTSIFAFTTPLAPRLPVIRARHDALIAWLRHAVSLFRNALTAWLPTR
jgi:hypothetical protein